MKPDWRTTTVVALCRRMLDTRDFTPAPILADALEDAGCDDERLLAGLRTPVPNENTEGRDTRWIKPRDVHRAFVEKLVNITAGPETAAAVDWINTFLSRINYQDIDEETGEWEEQRPHTYEWLVERMRAALAGEGEVCFGTDDGADMTRADETTRKHLWRNWSVVTGIPVPADVDDRVAFRCSC